MGNTEPQLDSSRHLLKLSVLGSGDSYFNCCPKGSHGNPQTQADASNRLLSTNWQPGPISEDNTHTTHWMWRSWAVDYMEFSLSVQESTVQEGTLHAVKGEMQTTTQPQTLWFTMVSYLQDMQDNGGTKLVGINNQCLIWLKAYLKWSPYTTLLRWPRT